MSNNFQLSVIIPVLQRADDLRELYAGYESALDDMGLTYEVIFVVDGGRGQIFNELKVLQGTGKKFKIILLAKHFGESTALLAGFDCAKSDLLLTLPAYHQIDPGSLGKMLNAMDDCDMAIGHRWPRAGGFLETVRRRAFHFLLRTLSGERYRDLGCGVRFFKRQLIDEIHLYGDQHRFFPVLASRQGFKVSEVDVRQSLQDKFTGRYRIREYLHRLLDIITVFFLVRFTKKPLRFFGMVGSILSALGTLVVITLVVQRLLFGIGLADRPALLLGSMLLVLGVQIFALGLIGELIIFTHAGHMKEYAVAEVVNQCPDSPQNK